MYTDLLTKIKNAQSARKEYVKVPYTNMDMAIAELLSKHNYLESALKKGRNPKRIIEIKLKYDKNRSGAIGEVKFLSKSSRRLYLGYRDLKPVKQGFGVAILSTPKGILTNKEARKMKIGGELLFEIWWSSTNNESITNIRIRKFERDSIFADRAKRIWVN